MYGEGDDDLAALVLERARAADVRLAVAESCTGGLLGARLTEIPGSSEVFVGGVDRIRTTQSSRSSSECRPPCSGEHGAVSEQVARSMAEGVARSFEVPAAIAVTGIAGPGGGTPEKPVGTVWLASSLRGAVVARRSLFPGSRYEIRARATQAALHLLLRQLDQRQSDRLSGTFAGL